MTTQDVNDIKTLIESLSVNLSNQIAGSQTSLETKFTDFASKMCTEVNSLKSTVAELQTQISNDVSGIKSQLSEHSSRIDNSEDDFQRLQLLCDLRVSGFPVRENENLFEIFDMVAAEIGYDVNVQPYPASIERIPIINRVTGLLMPSITIMLHFQIPKHKQFFYSYYLNKMPLDPKKFGLTEFNRISVGEHLTKRNAQIFKQAQIFKKSKKLMQAFTEDGIVKIRFSRGRNTQTYSVRNQLALESLVAQHNDVNGEPALNTDGSSHTATTSISNSNDTHTGSVNADANMLPHPSTVPSNNVEQTVNISATQSIPLPNNTVHNNNHLDTNGNVTPRTNRTPSQAPTQPNADLINKQHNLNGAQNSRDVNTANGTPINESNINSSMDTS